MSLDKSEFKDGQQSLKFVVNTCSSVGGVASPGFAQEIAVAPGSKHKVSFWVKNNGSTFSVKTGAVGAKTGAVKTVLHTNEQIDYWTQFEYNVSIPEGYKALRFELSILKPGTFWVDDIKITENLD